MNKRLPLYVLALLVGVYLLGRWDAPSYDETAHQHQVDAALKAGKAYRAEQAAHQRDAAKASAEVAAATALASRHKARADSIRAARPPLPAVAPDTCRPWVEHVASLDAENTSLRATIAQDSSALAASARIAAANQRGWDTAKARVVDLETLLAKQSRPDRILGIKLPSRKTMFLIGVATGFAATR